MEQVIIIIAAVVVVAGGGGRLRPAVPPPGRAPAGSTARRLPARATATAPAPPGPRVAEPGHRGDRRTVTAPPGRRARRPPAREPEKPPPSAGRLVRLRGRLARSQSALGGVLLGLLSREHLDDETWDEIEETLITADMGVAPARQLVEELRTEVKVAGTRDPDEVRALLKGQLLTQIGPDMDRTLHTQRHGDRPAVVLVVGVNGTGQDHRPAASWPGRSIGDGRTVLLGAADTFRAAAADQLQTWGDRVGAQVVRSDRRAPTPPASPSTRSTRASSAASTWSSWTRQGGCTPRPA